MGEDSVETIISLLALLISVAGVIYNLAQIRIQRQELKLRMEQWQQDLERSIRESVGSGQALKLFEARLKAYEPIWPLLKPTARFEWKRLGGKQKAEDSEQRAIQAVQEMADGLTSIAYGNAGLLMSDRSRKLLLHLRRGCGAFLKGRITFEELHNQAYWFKHSLRADLMIPDVAVDNEEFERYLSGVTMT